MNAEEIQKIGNLKPRSWIPEFRRFIVFTILVTFESFVIRH